MSITINLGLNNSDLYAGCEIEEVAGRLNMTTPVQEAVNIVGRNIESILSQVEDRDSVTLTGPMSVACYLVVFHAVVHRFRVVIYNDGRNGDIIVAKHG
jgi:hypothetical protein